MSDAAARLYERILVLRCQASDPAGFEELVSHYGPRLRYYLRKMLGESDCEDALQEVWCDALRGLHSLLDPTALSAWLYRIAHRTAARMLRKRGKGWRALPIAALFTVVLLFVSRRATLRQLNAGLLEVGEQLKLLRQGHGKLSAGDDSSA